MLLIPDFRNYVESIKTAFNQIERHEVVIDDTQLSRFLEAIPDDNKYIVLGILPKHNPVGDVDNIQSIDTASILILKKVTRSDQTHNNFLETFEEAQTITRNVILKMRADYLNEEEFCTVMKFLSIESIDVNPIWGLFGCDGYQIDFQLKTHF
ncbi:hypothetical protein [Lutibacter sp.]|uniref:hypothetical protein n=1 Tax=Lutibacter sp. TaxID=1925666 RepID=UPI003562A198